LYIDLTKSRSLSRDILIKTLRTALDCIISYILKNIKWQNGSKYVGILMIFNRIRLEERLLTEAFQDVFLQYTKTTKKLIPYVY